MNRLRTWLALAKRSGRLLEDVILVSILTGMILLASSQIFLRNFFDVGFIWTDELLRLLVLWIALAGAVAASRSDKQINIAVLDRYLPAKMVTVSKVVVHMFTAVICGIVTVVGVQFVKTSREYGDVLLGQVPAWWLQLALPVGFALLTWRYAVFGVSGLVRITRGGQGG